MRRYPLIRLAWDRLGRRLAAFFRGIFGPIPRDRTKGSDPSRCDGCDTAISIYDRTYIAGGFYCPLCTEEVQA